MRVVLFFLLAVSGISVSAHEQLPIGCAVYVPSGDMADVPKGHIPRFTSVFDTGNQFQEGGLIFNEYIIVIEPVPTTDAKTWGGATIMYFGEMVSQRYLEDAIAETLCIPDQFLG